MQRIVGRGAQGGGLLGAFGALLGIGSASSMTWAEPPPHIAVQLDYMRGRGTEKICGDEAALRRDLAADFGYDPTQPGAPSRLTVAITRGPGRTLDATMELRDAAGQVTWKDHKVAQNNDCLTLISGVSLAIRIGIDKIVVESPPKPAALPPPAAPPEAAPPGGALPFQVLLPAKVDPDRARPASSRPDPAERMRFRTGLGAAFALGAAPAPSAALSFQVGLRMPYVSFSLEGRGDLPASEEEEEFSTSRLAASFVPCGHYKIFVGCLMATAGRQFAFNEEEKGGGWYAGGGVRLGLEVPFAGPFAVRFSGDVMATLPSEIIVRVNGMEGYWAAPPINAAFGAGFLADF